MLPVLRRVAGGLAVLIGISLACPTCLAQNPASSLPGSPGPGYFQVPGYYEPTDGRLMRSDNDPERSKGLVWHGPFWAKAQPGWIWQPSGWIRSADGWVFRAGFWAPDRPRTAVAASSIAALNALNTASSTLVNADGTPPGTGLGRAPTPGTAYYIGNSAPGSSYPSVANTPTAIPGQSTYIGNSAPGSSYPSVANTPAGLPGSSFYIGNSAPGSSYPSLVPTGTSVGGYGYGTSPPGSNLGGQIGGVSPP